MEVTPFKRVSQIVQSKNSRMLHLLVKKFATYFVAGSGVQVRSTNCTHLLPYMQQATLEFQMLCRGVQTANSVLLATRSFSYMKSYIHIQGQLIEFFSSIWADIHSLEKQFYKAVAGSNTPSPPSPRLIQIKENDISRSKFEKSPLSLWKRRCSQPNHTFSNPFKKRQCEIRSGRQTRPLMSLKDAAADTH